MCIAPISRRVTGAITSFCTVSMLWPITGRIFPTNRGVPHFNAPLGVIPANIVINFTSPENRGIVLPDAENRTIVWIQYRSVTEGRTDGRTYGIPLASTALCIASNADAL